MTYFQYGGMPESRAVSGCEWRRVDGHWVLISDDDEVAHSTFALSEEPSEEVKAWKTRLNARKARGNGHGSVANTSVDKNGNNQTNRDAWQPMLRHVMGTGSLRRITCGLSEGLKILDLDTYAFTQRGFKYCAEFYTWLLKQCTHSISGTTQRHLFCMMERMVDQAISSELHMSEVNCLLQAAALSVESNHQQLIGSKMLWKKHRETVNNCLVRVSNAEVTPREEDGKPELLDLPKETLINIMSRFSDPADILNLGRTCSYLHVLSQDTFVWQQLALFHFTEKQLLPFLNQGELHCLEWTDIFKNCIGKHKKLREVYGDELVLCDNCRVIYWRLAGHPCHVQDKPPSHTTISPHQLKELFHL